MPKAAIDSGAVDSVAPLWKISTLILERQVVRKSQQGTTAMEKNPLA
jgi:chemotaxis response regulator CheB